jgi:hypothetical protein
LPFRRAREMDLAAHIQRTVPPKRAPMGRHAREMNLRICST